MATRRKQPAALLTYTDQLVATLQTSVPAAIIGGDGKAVHQARVTTRRLKAAVDVFRSISSSAHRKEFIKVLSKVRKSLGPVRDMEVMLGHVQQLRSGRNQPAIDWLLLLLRDKQTKARKSAAREIDSGKVQTKLGAWSGVRQEWTEAEETLDCVLAESLHLQLDRFIEHANALTGEGGSEIDPSTLDPHQLRIAGKALRYALELAIAGGHKLPATITRSFKKMQDALGLWHDFVTLNDKLLKLLIGNHHAPVMLAALDLAKDSVRHSNRQLEKFGRLWKERGKEIAQSIRQAFPLTHPVEETAIIETQTDLDRPDSTTAAEPPPDFPAPVQDETASA